MAETIEYFMLRDTDRTTLHRYIVAVDRLVGARIWLFVNKYVFWLLLWLILMKMQDGNKLIRQL